MRVGRVNGEFVINPTYAERAATTVNIMVVGHKDGIVMIESGAKEESEETILAAIEFGHAEIKKIVAAIDELVALAGKPKRAFIAPEFDQAYFDELSAKISDRLKDALDTKTHAQAGEPGADQGDQGRAGRGAARRRSGRQEEAGALLRKAAREDLPRAGDQGAHPARPPRLRRDSPDHHRDQRSAPRARLGAVYPRRDAGTGYGHAGHRRRRPAAGEL